MFFSRRSGHRFVDRGDSVGVDFSVGDLTIDDAWHDLDLSGVIPVNAKAVILRVECNAPAVGERAKFRTKGHSREDNVSIIRTQVAGIGISYDLFIVPDINGVIEYRISTIAYTVFEIVVGGWFV